MFNKERVLILVRGLPGSGKSTFAELIARFNVDKIFSADMFFEDESGNYNWVGDKLRYAHEWCQENVENALINDVPRVIVANVSNKEGDVNIYKVLAKKYQYEFVSVIVENRSGQSNIHNVPAESIKRMEKIFNIEL